MLDYQAKNFLFVVVYSGNSLLIFGVVVIALAQQQKMDLPGCIKTRIRIGVYIKSSLAITIGHYLILIQHINGDRAMAHLDDCLTVLEQY